MSLTGPTKDGLTWSYYTGYFAENVNYFTGTPVASGVVTAIPDINGGTGGYVPVNDSREYYSVQWVGYFLSNYTGSWTFYTTSDDASYLWIGPNAVTGYTTMNANVNNSGLHGMVKNSGVVSLVAGKYYDLRIQFGENQYGDDMIVSFQNPGLSETTNGSGFFYTAGGAPAVLTGPQPKIFVGPLMNYPSATGTPPTNDGTKLSFVRDSSQYLNFGSQTFDMAKGFSATCKFAFTGAAGNYERLFDFGGALNSASNNITIMRYGTGAGFRVWIVNGTTAQNYYDVNYGIIQSEVTNLAAVYDPNAAQPYWSIYKNGIKLVPSNVTFVSKATGTRTLAYSYVGNSLFNWDAYTSADIYSLNVYNRVLTANELVGPVAPSPWGIFTATPNGLTSAQPATNALALRQGYPGYGDGIYWINCGGVPQQTYCLMDSKWNGGGWMLIMKAAQGATFNWGSTHWTTTSTLNPTDTTTMVADAKFDVFNSVPVTDVMAVWPTSDIGAVNTGGSLAVSDGWVWLVKNWYTSAITPLAGFQIDRDATPADVFSFSGFSTTSPIWSYQTGLRAHVFGSGAHIAGPDYFITRWGFLWNNEIGTTSTQDAFAGIGLNAPSSSGGDFYFWVGTDKKGFNRNIAWLMYGR